MVTLFVRHQVEDFDTWLKALMGFADLNAGFHATNHEIFRGTEDSNDVTLKQDLPSVEAVHAMVGSAEIQAAMAKAGVVGAPTFWITEAVK